MSVKTKRWIIRIISSVAFLFLALFITIAVYGSSETLSPKRRILQDYHTKIIQSPDDFGLTIRSFTSRANTPCIVCSPVTSNIAVKSHQLRDELTRRNVALLPWGEIQGTVIMLHGHKGRKEDHLPICERFCAAGFACLCIDLPGHGDNPSPYTTFGIKEVAIIDSIWLDFQHRYPQSKGPVFMFGYSQGGAITLQAAAHSSIPLRACASVSSFASLDRPICSSASHLPFIIRDLTPITSRACALGIYCRAGFFPSDCSPLSAASHITIPVFMAHGTEDDFVEPSQAQEIYHAIPNSHKCLKMIPKAGHQNTLSTGSTALYTDMCQFFLEQI